VVASAKLPPPQSAVLELLDRPPDLIGTPFLLAHAAIFGELSLFFKTGSSDAYVLRIAAPS
jgi:hypothetical protein